MSEQKNPTLEELFDDLESAIDDVSTQITDAQYEIDEAYTKCDYAKDYINGADSNMSEVRDALQELQQRSGDFTTKKVQSELTKLIDILLKQQAKIS